MAIRKLQLHKETLRRLTGKELSQVVGGKWGTCTRTKTGKPNSRACRTNRGCPGTEPTKANGQNPEPTIDFYA